MYYHPNMTLMGIIVLMCHSALAMDYLGDTSSSLTPFFSRPDLFPVSLNITTIEPDLVTPGYIFTAPWGYKLLDHDVGPHIFDNDGNLVWSGAGTFGGVYSSHGPHVCQYHGTDHLCYYQGWQSRGHSQGVGLIVDNTYQVVKTLRLAGTAAALFDMHEFHLIDDGKKALFTAYQAQPYDLSPYGMSENIGWIQNSLFQEISVETGELLFEWRSLDHEETSPKYGQVLPGETLAGGKGTTASDAWDYFHINSVDKNENGDYLISSRHTSALYLISGEDGRVLWHLDGWLLSSHFQKDFYFSSQHDARWQHSNATHTTISMFDNAYDEFKPHDNQTHPYSRGLVFVIDNEARTATFSHEYMHHVPNGPPVLSGSQGNFQLLPNGNAFLGWGAQPFFSEHLPNGALVLHAFFNNPTGSTMNYKARKYNWTAVPAHDPALWSYSYNGSATTFYVSWNGATTVQTWRFCVSDDGVEGLWRRVGEAPKRGFETVLRWDGFARWAFAEAVDGEGMVLRRSGVVEVFVPSEALRQACDVNGCMEIPRVGAEGWSTFEVSGSGMQEEVFGSDFAFDGKSHYLPKPDQDGFSSSSRMLMLGLILSTGVCIAGLGVWLYQKMWSKLQIKYTKLKVELSDISSSSR